MRRTLLLGLPIALLSGQTAASPAAPAPIFPPDRICATDLTLTPPARMVHPLYLIRDLIEAGPVSDAALDANGDGDTLLIEKQLAFTQPNYCHASPERRCTPQDEKALIRLHDQLAEFVRTEGGAWYHFERLREPDPVDRAAVPALDPAFEVKGQPFQIGEILQVPPQFVRIVCRDEPLAPQAASIPPADAEPVGWEHDPDGNEGFRLTGSIDDLNKSRQRLTNVRPAQFSINSDLKANVTTYLIDAVAGYDLEFAKGKEYNASLIPFVFLNRLFNNTNNEIDKLGTGLQLALEMQDSPIGYGEVAMTPQYTTDTDFRTKIGTLKFRWTPTLPQDALVPLGLYRTYGPLLGQVNLDLLSDVGHVFDAGGNPDLEDSDEFLRVGGRLGFQIRGAKDTLLEQIELDVSNRYLYNVEGIPRDINYFQTSLSYLFPNMDNYKLSFSFTSGRTDDTLTDVEFWSSQLGIRF
jgi:hypothetical protein